MSINSIFLLFLLPSFLLAQKNQYTIDFQLKMNGERIMAEKGYWIEALADSVYIETLKFYISEVRLFQNDSCVDSLDKKHLLIDLESPVSQQITFLRKNKMLFNKIKFNIGIDSFTNVSGAYGGDLDPTTGMYWTWQSGYINFKLEGRSNSCPARNHFFQFHIGGYQYPYNTLQAIELSVLDTHNSVITVAIDKLLAKTNLAVLFEVMSPNQKALEMARYLTSIFETTE